METIADGIYMIGISDTDDVLDVEEDSIKDGAGIISYRKHGGDNQKWKIEKQKDGYYKITGVSSRKVMESEGADNKKDGTRVQIWSDNGGNNQLWKIEKDGSQYAFKNKNGLYLYIKNETDKQVAMGYSGNKTGFRITQPFYRFAVTSDIEAQKKKSAYYLNDLNLLANLLRKDYSNLSFLALCGDLTDQNKREETKVINDFIKEQEKKNVFEICEGFGNHDTQFNVQVGYDTQGLIKSRNKSKKARKNGYYIVDKKSDYHYKWSEIIGFNSDKKPVTIHFFMLNNVPGYNTIDRICGNDKNTLPNERNPYYSLNFLETQLQGMNKDDYYILFFHIAFDSGERWWPDYSKRDFYTVIEKSTAKYITSFFGHLIGTDGIVLEEKLSPGKEGNSLYGYLLQTVNNGEESAHGADFASVVDVQICDNILECKISPVLMENGTLKNGRLLLKDHHSVSDLAESVTLRFDLSTGKEMDRVTIKK